METIDCHSFHFCHKKLKITQCFNNHQWHFEWFNYRITIVNITLEKVLHFISLFIFAEQFSPINCFYHFNLFIYFLNWMIIMFQTSHILSYDMLRNESGLPRTLNCFIFIYTCGQSFFLSCAAQKENISCLFLSFKTQF